MGIKSFYTVSITVVCCILWIQRQSSIFIHRTNFKLYLAGIQATTQRYQKPETRTSVTERKIQRAPFLIEALRERITWRFC